ncbi:MAG: 4-(cytidine 5'-diphospho)-2-C-methyl-D-erythritol kinase [bacterium]
MLKLKAFAKINLSLKILGTRQDSYHELESVMQSVTLFDTLTLTPIDSGIEVITTNLQLPTNNKNLAYKAAEEFFRVQGVGSSGIKIYIEKQIPVGAGLAGGSADAAAVLVGLNNIYGKKLSQEELMVVGAKIGSDVPFCIMGGNCTVKGRGERVTRNTLNETRNYLLVIPEVEVSTKWAYDAWDESQMKNEKCKMKNEGSKNDLESVVIKKYPVIQKVKDRMLELGCTFAQMSGSGSSVFGFPADDKKLREIRKEYGRSYYVETADSGVEIFSV